MFTLETRVVMACILLCRYTRDWKKIQAHIGTKTAVQVSASCHYVFYLYHKHAACWQTTLLLSLTSEVPVAVGEL